MRQLQLRVPEEHASEVVRLARRWNAFDPAIVPTMPVDERASSLVLLALPNDRVGSFVAELVRIAPDASLLLLPYGALALRQPLDGVHDQVREVSTRSPFELVVGALQSLGSWKGMLLYALLSGVVAAYGVIFDTSYLLVAAMLIAPIGAPAMVCAVGAAVGDVRMIARGALRFWAALALLGGASLALGLAYGLGVSTATMEQISSLSRWALLIAVAGGAAGAQAQVQDERDSLVTGTATGFLVAVALSPPAAVLGLSVALQRWDYFAQMLLILAMTFFGVIVGGWASLTLWGVRASAITAGRGKRAVRRGTAVAAAAVALALVAVQLQPSPRFQKADLSRAAVGVVQKALETEPSARLIQASAEFTRRDLAEVEGETLLLDVVVQANTERNEDGLDRSLRLLLEEAVRARLPGVTPLTRLSILPATSTAQPAK